MSGATATTTGIPSWGAGARDWAEVQEQGPLPLHAAVLDGARVARGTRLLDAGCGTGLVALLARLRGANVTAIDVSAGMLAVARERLPDHLEGGGSDPLRLLDPARIPLSVLGKPGVGLGRGAERLRAVPRRALALEQPGDLEQSLLRIHVRLPPAQPAASSRDAATHASSFATARPSSTAASALPNASRRRCTIGTCACAASWDSS